MDVTATRRLAAAFRDERDGAAGKSRELIEALLDHSPDPLSRRQFTPGHITCSGLVLGAALDRILLVEHRRLGRWLLPGGHVEAEDRDAVDAARREVLEETGADLDPGFQPWLVGLDVHGIPPKRDEPFHLHYDLIFSFRSRSDRAVCSPESLSVAWLRRDEFEHSQLPPNIRLAFERAITQA